MCRILTHDVFIYTIHQLLKPTFFIMPGNRIFFKDITPDSEYERVTGDFFRRRAATVLQRALRKKRLENTKTPADKTRLYSRSGKIDETLKIYYAEAERPFSSLPGITEPSEADIPFLESLKAASEAGLYHEIDYHHPDFTRYLFQALRHAYISANQLLTIKLMYEALIAFNNGKLPETPAKTQFNRYRLTLDNMGPYSPKVIGYFFHKEEIKLKSVLTETKVFEPHYYTIDFNIKQTTCFFYYIIYFDQLKNNKIFIERLMDFIQQHFKGDREKQTFLTHLENYHKQQKPSAKKALLKGLKDIEPDCDFYSDRVIPEAIKIRDSMMLLVALLAVDCQIPSIVRSTNFDVSNPSTPSMSFVLPTSETFNLLQSVLHTEEATLATPVLGQETPRMIRAMDAIPANKIRQESLSEENPLPASLIGLKTLYPYSDMLPKPARPVELTHPDTIATDKPHGADCYDFFLSWHDTFHAWRNGANFKSMIRHLRQLHDEKGGLAIDHSGMSKVLWALTDMDFSGGNIIRQTSFYSSRLILIYSAIVHILEKAGFSFDTPSDDNDLILFDMIKQPAIWRSYFFNHSLNEMTDVLITEFFIFFKSKNGLSINSYLTLLEQINHCNDLDRLSSLSESIEPYASCFTNKFAKDSFRFLIAFQRIRLMVKEHPDNSLFDIIFRQLLSVNALIKDELIHLLNRKQYENLLYYSANTGLYFKPEIRVILKKLPFTVSPCLRKNSPETLNLSILFLLREQFTPTLKRQYFLSYCQYHFPTETQILSFPALDGIDNAFEITEQGQIIARSDNTLLTSFKAIRGFIFIQTKNDDVKETLITNALNEKIGTIETRSMRSLNLYKITKSDNERKEIIKLFTLTTDGEVVFKTSEDDLIQPMPSSSFKLLSMIYEKTDHLEIKRSLIRQLFDRKELVFDMKIDLPRHLCNEDEMLIPSKSLLEIFTSRAAQANLASSFNGQYKQFSDGRWGYSKPKLKAKSKVAYGEHISDLKNLFKVSNNLNQLCTFYQNLYEMVEDNLQDRYTRQSQNVFMAMSRDNNPLSGTQITHLHFIKHFFQEDIALISLTHQDRAYLQSKLDSPDFFINHNLTRFSFFRKEPSNMLLSKYTTTHQQIQSILNRC